MDHYVGQTSCVCGSVRISNFHIHITKTVAFSAAAPGHSVVFIQRQLFKAHQPNYTVKGGNVSSVTLHDYIIVISRDIKYAYSQVEDHHDQRKKDRRQSICSRSML